MISIDSETSGVDFFHGTRPFFVTAANETGKVLYWEWPVDPLTRQPVIPQQDLVDIVEMLEEADEVVGQNIKFDVRALETIGIGDWDWSKTHDTLVAGHILASNQPHNLTAMADAYLNVDILPHEVRLQEAVEKARRFCRSHLPTWAIAREGRSDMPSAGEKVWRADYWLPKAVYQHLVEMKSRVREWETSEDKSKRRKKNEYDKVWQPMLRQAEADKWDTVLRDYSNMDSAVTLPLWVEQRRLLHERGYWKIYCEKVKQLQAVYPMETRGVGVIAENLQSMKVEYEKDTYSLSERCLDIAKGYGHDLVLPAGSANNKSMTTFVFDVLKLPVLKVTEKGNPSFDKDVIEEYKKTLDGDQLDFIKCLSGRRKRGKSLEFIKAYEKHGIDDRSGMLLLHPNLKPTATATTRFSCDNPNLQQASKQESLCELCQGDGCDECGGTGEDLHSVRNIFGPGPGREWWTADAENIELRIPAYRSGQRELIELFERPNDPPFYGSQHLLNFSVVYNDIWQEELGRVGQERVGPHCKKKYASTWYQWCKNGDFAIQYQCGRSTADRSFRRVGAYDLLKSTFADLEALNQHYVAMANRLGYIETLPDKTVDPQRGYPLLCRRTEWGNAMPTVPLNYMSQGTAGWWMVKAMNRCHEKLKRWRKMFAFDAWMILTVHDELVFDFPRGADPRVDVAKSNLGRAMELRGLMQAGGEDIGIPTPVALSYHPETWADGHKVSQLKGAA